MKEKTKIHCRKCADKKSPIESFLEKQLWGKGNGQHYRLTCSNPECDFSRDDVNQNFIDFMESNGEEK